MTLPPDASLRSIRRWLVVLAFLLGIAVVTLAEIGLSMREPHEPLVFATAAAAGFAVVIATVVTWLRGIDFFSMTQDESAD
jgi:peptidoglycan/LPS O-acetylase OafA/YrhL